MALAAEDVVAIQQLYAAYNHHVDAGRGEEWADLFVEGASFDTGFGIVLQGDRQAFVDFAAAVPVMLPGGRHLVSNVLVEGDGTSATGKAYLQVWVTNDDVTKTALSVTGTYDDVLEKVDGRWRFVSRVMTPDRV